MLKVQWVHNEGAMQFNLAFLWFHECCVSSSPALPSIQLPLFWTVVSFSWHIFLEFPPFFLLNFKKYPTYSSWPALVGFRCWQCLLIHHPSPHRAVSSIEQKCNIVNHQIRPFSWWVVLLKYSLRIPSPPKIIKTLPHFPQLPLQLYLSHLGLQSFQRWPLFGLRLLSKDTFLHRLCHLCAITRSLILSSLVRAVTRWAPKFLNTFLKSIFYLFCL